MESNPERGSGSLLGSLFQLSDRQTNSVLDVIGSLMGVGMQAMGSNPMRQAMGFDNPFTEIISGLTSKLDEARPQVSPYEQRLRALTETRGMSREDAIANQAHAMRLGTDYNRDGAVTDDEWRKYQNSGANNAPAPMHYGSMGVGGAPQFGMWGYGSLNQR